MTLTIEWRRSMAMTFGAAALVIFALHCTTYFFVFDDFAIIGTAADYSLKSIVTQPLFGFYRPAVVLLTKAHFAVASWSHPSTYAAESISLHCLNVFVLILIARRLELSQAHTRLAAVLFLLSPWASETYFWVAGRFDLLSTLGILTAILAALWGMLTPIWGKLAAAAALTFAGTALAVLSKESAVMVPALLAGTLLVTPYERTRGLRRRLLLVVSSGLAVLIYLAARQQIIPSLQGAYGSIAVLLANSPLQANLWKDVRALAWVPLPAFVAGGFGATHILEFTIVALTLIAAITALRRMPYLLTLTVGAFLISLVPVIWVGLPPASSGGGRQLYGPGVWFCLLLGSVATIEGRRSGIAMGAVLACALAIMLTSVGYEGVVWRQATTLSRLTIQQLAPYRDTAEKLFIANMPFWYNEGPYVLKDYAFSQYFAPTATRVRGRAMQLEYARAQAKFVQWVPQYGDAIPSSEERVVFLNLPVSGMPLVPATPGPIRAAVHGRSVTLSWDTGPSGGRIDGFAIQASLEPKFVSVLTTINTESWQRERVVNAVPPNQYFVRVLAFNANGFSQPSPTISVVVDESDR